MTRRARSRGRWLPFVLALAAAAGCRAPAAANKETVRNYMDAFGRGDHAAILACLTDDVEWVVPGAFRLQGKEAFDREIANPAFTGLPVIAVDRLVEEDDVVVAEGTVRTVHKEDGPLRIAYCDVFTMEGGRIRRLVSYLSVVRE